jgi:hypothetical protein
MTIERFRADRKEAGRAIDVTTCDIRWAGGAHELITWCKWRPAFNNAGGRAGGAHELITWCKWRPGLDAGDRA